MDDYRAIRVEEGAKLRFCMRCGAVVIHRRIHDEWHNTGDRLEVATAAMLLKLANLASQEIHTM